MAGDESQPHILVVPFPAQGHLIPLLDLTHRLLRLFPRPPLITVVTTPLNLPLISPLLSASALIQPLILDFPDYPSLPSHAQHVRSLPSKSAMGALIHALSFLSPQILSWARSAPAPPTAVLSDFFLGWTHRLALDLRVPRFAFFSSGALVVSLFHHLFLDGPGGVGPALPTFRYDHLPSLFRRYDGADKSRSPEWEFVREYMVANSSNHAAVINTFDALEGKYLSHLRQVYGHKRVWAVGPIGASIPGSGRGGKSSVQPEEVQAWLDGCPEKSVVYVCFGSQFDLAGAQLRALAEALKLSRTRFVWCVGAGGVPEGTDFEGGRHLVIKGWAPQVEILGHRSVGAFLTHCGWNSVLEGIVRDVLLLTWPMEADQFANARLLVGEMRMAVEACEGGPEVVPVVEELAKVVAGAVDGGMWREVKARVEEMRMLAAAAVEEGGSSRRDMEELVKELSEAKLIKD